MRRALTILAALALIAGGLPAQETGALATADGVPDGWMMRFDRAGTGQDMVDFKVMEPGWHVTTGRNGAAIFWQPEMTASSPYTVSTTIHLFDPASHAEAFGLFIGGEELAAADQQYLYFLVRQTGEYLIRRRAGSETENVVGWTGHDAIPEAPVGEEGPTQYDLGVEVGVEDVAFKVNGTTVHTMPAAELQTDGQVGLRINHMLDVHVEALELTRGM